MATSEDAEPLQIFIDSAKELEASKFVARAKESIASSMQQLCDRVHSALDFVALRNNSAPAAALRMLNSGRTRIAGAGCGSNWLSAGFLWENRGPWERLRRSDKVRPLLVHRQNSVTEQPRLNEQQIVHVGSAQLNRFWQFVLELPPRRNALASTALHRHCLVL